MKKYIGFFSILLITSIASAAVEEIKSPDQLKNLLGSNKQVALLIYMDGCPACHAFEPFFDRMSQNKGNGGTVFAKVEKDIYQKLPKSITGLLKERLRAFPTIVKFVDGKETGRHTGNDPDKVESLLE